MLLAELDTLQEHHTDAHSASILAAVHDYAEHIVPME